MIRGVDKGRKGNLIYKNGYTYILRDEDAFEAYEGDLAHWLNGEWVGDSSAEEE